jgi:hypothetical protein
MCEECATVKAFVKARNFGPYSCELPLFGKLRGRAGREAGSVIVIAMVFVMIFLILGVALYWLVISQTHATELERTDVKAFNVAEAGVDAGMLSLKLAWPDQPPPAPQAAVDNAALKTAIKAGTSGLWDPTRVSPSQFIQVTMYDNVDAAGETTSIPYPGAPTWDSNGDDKMFVDSTANVDNDRHRILILAQLQKWELTFPLGLALFAGMVDSNGQGLEVSVEDPNPAPQVPYAYYDVHDAQHKGVDEGYAVAPTSSPTTFPNVVDEGLRGSLEAIASTQGSYFTSASAANTFLTSGQANGRVVYIKSDTAVTISGDSQIGTVAKPVVVVIDTPDGSVNGWDMRGGADFYGVLITIGDSELRGTSGIHGALYCSGALDNKGDGSSGEINYNQAVINNLNGQYPISVNIVPNTWEEYTLPATSGS